MKRMIKDLRKGGFAGAKARYSFRLVCICFGLIAVAALLCVLSGGIGLGAGAVLAGVVPVGFALPDGVDFNEKERAGLKALADHFNAQFKSYVDNKINEEKLMEKMQEKLKSWADENGISKEAFEKMQSSLKEQGKTITSLKEQGVPVKGARGLKSAFEKNYDKFVSAVKDNKVGFCIKSVDEHTAANIQTTSNSITTTSGATLAEEIGENNELFMKRRGREYIHDIANVTVVDEVPESFNFYEEGDEKGAIAVVSENGLKPQVHLSLIKNKVDAKKAAGYIVVTEEMLKWRSRAWAQIQRLFNDKVWRDYEKLLTEDLLSNATAYTTTALDDTIAAPTDFDAIVASVLQLESLEYRPDVLIINPADKWKLALTQANNGTFILPYIQNGGEFSLLGLRVITTTRIASGTFLSGESDTWFIEEEAPQIRTGLVNDDLIHNRMTIIGELFFLSYVPSNNAGSFVKSTFSTVKEALKAPEAGVGG